jgi:hypothetical protein
MAIRNFTKYFLFVTCALASWSAQSRAQQPDLQGTYAIDAAASDDIKAAIDRGTAEMNFLIRDIARSRTAQTNPRYEYIAISHGSNTVSIQFDTREPLVIPLDGRSVPWTREDGGKYNVTAQWKATQLVMDFKSDDGERVNTFILGADGKSLKLHVRLTSQHLPAPITYMLAYKREIS